MFVDACAIVAILADEPDAAVYAREIDGASDAWTSALAAWEAIIVLSRPDKLACSYRKAERAVTLWMENRGIALRAAEDPRAILSNAVAVAEDYGLSRRALSNFDCFHYAYAQTAGAPMLTLDERLRATDVETRPCSD